MCAEIVCGIDASPASVSAAYLAARLGRGLGFESVLVHTEPAARGPELAKAPLAHARELGRLHALVEANDFSAGASVEISEGDPGRELVRAAESHGANFAIVGSHGSAATQAAVGGVTATVMRQAPCPVIVVPPRLRRRRSRTRGSYAVVCALHETTGVGLRLAAGLVTRLGGHLHALDTSRAGVADSDDALLSLAEELPADLLFVASLEAAARLVPRASCPTVMVPPSADAGVSSREQFEVTHRVA
jgi:nucleotide-binding universal stress UspA family protein